MRELRDMRELRSKHDDKAQGMRHNARAIVEKLLGSLGVA